LSPKAANSSGEYSLEVITVQRTITINAIPQNKEYLNQEYQMRRIKGSFDAVSANHQKKAWGTLFFQEDSNKSKKAP
jgi:hypothetical protein